jgi:hypothetical protein
MRQRVPHGNVHREAWRECRSNPREIVEWVHRQLEDTPFADQNFAPFPKIIVVAGICADDIARILITVPSSHPVIRAAISAGRPFCVTTPRRSLHATSS